MAAVIPRRRPGISAPEDDTALETFGQNVAEVGKGIIPGAIQLGGTALKGVGAGKVAIERYEFEIADILRRVPTMTREQLREARADARRELGPVRAGFFFRAMSEVMAGDDPEEVIRSNYPQTLGVELPKVTESSIYEAGEVVGEFGRELFPAAPGYEESLGRQLGEGVGSMVGGAALAMIPGAGPAIAATAFSFAGSGEAVERAVQAGATEEQIIEAARLGHIPGLTDSLPVEVLTGRIPLPGGKFIRLAAASLGSALKIASRIGWTALVEGVQEGGQAWLQNLIAREVYKPEQALTEGILPEAGLGAGVGAIVETVATPFRRRGGAKGAKAAPEVVPEPGARRAPSLEDIEERLARTEAPGLPQTVPETQPPPAPTATAAAPGLETVTTEQPPQARPQVITPEQVLEARAKPRFQGEPVGPRFKGRAIREPGAAPAPLGRTAERGVPFERPQAPVEPEAAPVVPETITAAAVKTRTGEVFTGEFHSAAIERAREAGFEQKDI
ncbi:MAG: hypothetical protein IH993_04150, partial [Proteobacteria bacterium]|nr:hypothetical protein [Pseudomonadota bacterium]